MREATFLSQNEEKWKKVESILSKENSLTSSETSKLFIELTDDLSYARTHYPNSVTTKYLNSLSMGIYQQITRKRKLSFAGIWRFWSQEIPLAVAKNHRTMLFTFLFFAMCVLIGAVSTHYDENYPRVILGDRYIDMTLENIENGDPMAVYKGEGRGQMFIGITLNNIRVAAKTFAAGIIFGFGALYFLFTNGIMLGAFQYFFVNQDLFWESALSIWIHGTLEISSIVIAGTAGAVLGRSFLFPGSYSRLQSFVIYSRQAVRIYLGTIPIFIIAGFLEGFVTRLTDAPTLFKLFVILGSLTFILGYFVWWPIRLKKQLGAH